MQHVRPVLNLAIVRMVVDTARLDNHQIGSPPWERCQRAAVALSLLMSATTHLNRHHPPRFVFKRETGVDMIGRLTEAMVTGKLTSQVPKSKCSACGERMMNLTHPGGDHRGDRCLGCGDRLSLTRMRSKFWGGRSALGDWLVLECDVLAKLERMFWHAFAKYYRRLHPGSDLRMHSVEDRVFVLIFGKRDFVEFFGMNTTLESRATTALASTLRLNRRGQKERKQLCSSVPGEVYERAINRAKMVAPFGCRPHIQPKRLRFATNPRANLLERSATAVANLVAAKRHLKQKVFALLSVDLAKSLAAMLSTAKK